MGEYNPFEAPPETIGEIALVARLRDVLQHDEGLTGLNRQARRAAEKALRRRAGREALQTAAAAETMFASRGDGGRSGR
jgi:hypothetical protein